LKEDFVKLIPTNMNFEQAASLFAYVTAWYEHKEGESEGESSQELTIFVGIV
jgi:hypothetical protein